MIQAGRHSDLYNPGRVVALDAGRRRGHRFPSEPRLIRAPARAKGKADRNPRRCARPVRALAIKKGRDGRTAKRSRMARIISVVGPPDSGKRRPPQPPPARFWQRLP